MALYTVYYQQMHSVLYIFIIQNTHMFRPYILPSSGSYKFGRRVQRIWQLVIGKWQTIYIYIYIYIYIKYIYA